VENGVDAQNALQLLAGIGGTGTAIYSNKSVLNASDIETPALQVGGVDVSNKVANPIPENGVFARVMPERFAKAFRDGKGTIGGGNEVFVTSADDLAGLTTIKGTQQRLSLFSDELGTVPNLGSDYLVTFRVKNLTGTNGVGLRTPIETSPPRGWGFIQGGKTGGGAREFFFNNGTADDLGIYDIILTPLK